MTRPPLHVVLSSVLAARMEGSNRTGLLAVLRPDFRHHVPKPRAAADDTVVPLPRVIPMPTRAQDDDDPDPAA